MLLAEAIVTQVMPSSAWAAWVAAFDASIVSRRRAVRAGWVYR